MFNSKIKRGSRRFYFSETARICATYLVMCRETFNSWACFCGYPYGLYSLHLGLHPTTRSLLAADEVGPPCILLKLKDSLSFTGSLGLGASLIGLCPST